MKRQFPATGKTLSRNEQLNCKGGLGDEGYYTLICYHVSTGFIEMQTGTCLAESGAEMGGIYCERFTGLEGAVLAGGACIAGGDDFG